MHLPSRGSLFEETLEIGSCTCCSVQLFLEASGFCLEIWKWCYGWHVYFLPGESVQLQPACCLVPQFFVLCETVAQ